MLASPSAPVYLPGRFGQYRVDRMSTREVPAPERAGGEVAAPRPRGDGPPDPQRGPPDPQRAGARTDGRAAPAPVTTPGGRRAPGGASGSAARYTGATDEGRLNPFRRRAVAYDDQARRPGRGPAPPPVEVLRVRRVVRRVDTWSLFRFSVLLYLCALFVFLVAAVGLWTVASAAGAIPSIEDFITQLFALKKFRFQASQLLVGTVAIGVIGVMAATLFTVIAGVLYNLISDVVGGIELTVLEEEPLEVVG